ncbi:MAG: minichromosome maintenance protein MCM [Candidatus Aenigmarchaeota archaeon]|nr:minichromosome maintenance protein MCM [Candidatus Aenigmarchaeota archaeon]
MEVEKFEEFFSQYYEKDLLAAAAKGEKSLVVDFSLLDKFDPELADQLLNSPDEVMDYAREALSNIDLPEGNLEIEPRFKNLPEQNILRIRNLRSEHIGKFVSLDGIVKRASEVKPEVSYAVYECPLCQEKISVMQDERTIKPPARCTNPECRVKSGFVQVDRKLFDARWIFIEEPFEMADGDRPGETSVYLKNDLTTPNMQRKTDPGNRIRVNGVLKEIQRTVRGKVKTQMDTYVEANFVEPTEIEWEEVIISEEDEEKIKEFANDPKVYKRLVDSIAPSIFGMDEIKKAVIFQLFGGVPQKLPDRTKIRGDIHILLIGDPSTGKSQILKLVSKVIPRGKYVAGRGATAAGLTATVVKDEEFLGGWVLEAGAMVLANKGIIAIDEFDKMTKEDQIAMHEALEQQTVSVAKASIVATLPAQVSVLAGANPKYLRFDPYKSVAEQVEIPDTLLGRFDLKFALKDIPDKVKDERLATHIIETRLKPETVTPEISPEFIRKYVAYARKYCKPEMTREAADRLKNFYLDMRSLYTGEGAIAITLRQNEGLLRLAEASAKIRLSPKVEIQDAERAVEIMRYSIQQLGYDYETGKIDIDKTEGMPASQRSKIHAILDILEMLEKKLGKPVSKEEIIATAEEQGIKASTTEELLRRLKTEGSIFEPRVNYIERIG